MGTHKFRLSNMMPNAWLYKLKDIGREEKQNNTPSIKKKHSSSTSATTASTMSTTSTQTATTKPHTYKPRQQTHHSHSRKSYYYTRDLCPNDQNDPFYNPQPHFTSTPRKPTKHKTPPRKSTKSSSTSAGRFRCRASIDSVSSKPETMLDHGSSASSSNSSLDLSSTLQPPDETLVPEFRLDRVLPTKSSFNKIDSRSPSPSCNANRDTIIRVDKNSFNSNLDSTLDGADDDTVCEFVLRPIITKPAKTSTGNHRVGDEKTGTRHKAAKKKSKSPHTAKVASLASQANDASLSVEVAKEQKRTSTSSKKFWAHSPGFRVRVNSPRLVNRKLHQGHPRKSLSSRISGRRLSGSFAVVKSSLDPQRDFKESMVEMIVENNLKGSKDLEELLACYLSLNSEEYHDVIIKVFKQIWIDLSVIRLTGNLA